MHYVRAALGGYNGMERVPFPTPPPTTSLASKAGAKLPAGPSLSIDCPPPPGPIIPQPLEIGCPD